MYVQVYLFIILYSYWIAITIIQYLLSIVVHVYEYMSVFTQLYLRKWVQLLYQRIMQPFIRNTSTFQWGRRLLPYLGMVGRFHGDDHRFCDCQSDLVLIVWCNQIRLTPSFCFVFILTSLCEVWYQSWPTLPPQWGGGQCAPLNGTEVTPPPIGGSDPALPKLIRCQLWARMSAPSRGGGPLPVGDPDPALPN